MTKVISKSSLQATSAMNDLALVASKERAMFVAGYFKTGKGEYGESDVFIGVSVPAMRVIARQYLELALSEVKKLLTSKVHEHRFVALLVLCLQYAKKPESQKEIFETYLAHTKFINNWDLVDTSARDIVGHFIWNHFGAAKRKMFLSKLARSKMLWERRIAIIATQYGIKQGEFSETMFVAELLLKDTHDLMHKAVGWTLREMGKRNSAGGSLLIEFLNMHAAVLPRTMLRYAIERLDKKEKNKYMSMKYLQKNGSKQSR